MPTTRVPQDFTLQETGVRYGTIGWQEFLRQKRDLLSDYDSAKEQSRNRPVRTEHGNVAEASFRSWLSAFLPRRFGVTSGYIIPDVRAADYVLYHYDVIVFDALEAPVLWTSANPDLADQGRVRAIPAEHVRGVVEVKATLNRRNILDAKTKLQQLAKLERYLKTPFVSCMLFVEVLQPEQRTALLAKDLIDRGIPGYFGGLILRAEGLDENLAARFGFVATGGEPFDEGSMPLVRAIGELQRDESGNPQLTQQGDTCEAVSAEDAWHVNLGYSPVLHDIELTWSYNSFPMFVFELLDRVRGAYTPGLASARYGTSYLR
jgi:hypothetical protein